MIFQLKASGSWKSQRSRASLSEVMSACIEPHDSRIARGVYTRSMTSCPRRIKVMYCRKYCDWFGCTSFAQSSPGRCSIVSPRPGRLDALDTPDGTPGGFSPKESTSLDIGCRLPLCIAIAKKAPPCSVVNSSSSSGIGKGVVQSSSLGAVGRPVMTLIRRSSE